MKLLTFVFVACLPIVLLGQEPNPMQNIGQAGQQTGPGNTVPIFKVQVVSRSVAAVSYRDRSNWTKVDFQGTSLAPQAKGLAEVRSQLGHMQIKIGVKNLPAASTFGPLYLSYVLWAITPDGHPSNLGEIVVDSHGNYDGEVTTDLQAFGLIITAEPYFAVHQPSDVVVMQNMIRNDTRGSWETVQAHFELLPRGNYTYHVPESELKPVDLNSNKKSPLEVYEAQNAVQIAEYAKANQYASDVFQNAETLWQQAQDYQARKEWKSAIMSARESVEKAEDARIISLRKQQQIAQQQERDEAAARQAAAQRQAQDEAARAEQAREQALEAQRQAQEQAAQRAAADAEAQKAQQTAEEANRLREQAEQQKEQLRQQLLQQFNSVLPTRETPRGLVVNMQDVLFATGKYELTQPAQLALARIAGIVISHPGLNLRVEGYTDSTGTDAFNQKLSEQRASTVQSFLIQQGLNPQNVSSAGYGESYPVASNDTASGRKLNRRVELVVSGEVIGAQDRRPAESAGARELRPIAATIAPRKSSESNG